MIAAIGPHLGEQVLKRSREGCFEFGVGCSLSIQGIQWHARTQFFRHPPSEVLKFFIAKKSENQAKYASMRHAGAYLYGSVKKPTKRCKTT